jgi:hypothetical protein
MLPASSIGPPFAGPGSEHVEVAMTDHDDAMRNAVTKG